MNLFRDAELQNILAATHKKIKESVDKYMKNTILSRSLYMKKTCPRER